MTPVLIVVSVLESENAVQRHRDLAWRHQSGERVGGYAARRLR